MNPWHSVTVRFLYARQRSSDAWHLLRCSLGAGLVVLISGCAWLWPAPPQPAPEPEPVQYSYVSLPSPQFEREAVQYITVPLPPTEPPKKTAHDEVTILPKKDGSIGGVVVRTDGVAVLLDKAYATALVEGPGLVTESTYDSELARQDFAEVRRGGTEEPARRNQRQVSLD